MTGTAAIVIALLADGAGPPAQGPEPVALHGPPIIDTGDSPLRWDNIEGAPLWAGGKAPEYSFRAGMRRVRLGLGEYTAVIVPRSAVLRIHSLGGRLPAEDLELQVSDGSGLWIPARPSDTSDPSSLILHPHLLAPALVRVARSGSGSLPGEGALEPVPLDLAFFISRLVREAAAARYRTLVSIEAPSARISTPAQLAGDLWWRLEPGNPATVSVNGPARLAILSRLEYPPGEGAAIQGYRLRLVTGDLPRTIALETSIDESAVFHVDGAPALIGRERCAFVEVSGGPGAIVLESTSAVFIRVLWSGPGDYLLSQAPPAAALPFLCRPWPEPDPSPLSADSLAAALRWEDFSAADLFRLLRDPRIRDGALAGAILCRGLAEVVGAPLEDRAMALSIQRRYARYRGLVPVEMRTRLPQLAALFTERAIADPLQPERELVLHENFLGEALHGFIVGIFNRVPQVPESLIYDIPERFAPSYLRIAIVRPSFPARCLLMLQLDGGSPMPLRFAVGPGEPAADLVPSRAEAALAALRSIQAPRWMAALGPLAASRPILTVVEAATAEIPLPRSVSRVRLWIESADFSPSIAMAYLSESPYEPTERECLEALRKTAADGGSRSGLADLFTRWSAGAAPDELLAGWAPLLRYLEAARERFSSGTVPPRAAPPDLVARDLQALQRAREAAEAFEENGDWLPAIEAWSTLLSIADRDAYRLGRIRVVGVLEKLGEGFLAEMQLRGILAHEPDPRLRREARDLLESHYRAAGDGESALDLLADAATSDRDPATIHALAAALVEDGSPGLALWAGLTLPPEDRPLEVLLRAAFQIRWWRTYEELIGELPLAEDRCRWLGLRAGFEGRYRESLDLFSRGGPLGRAMERSLRRALAIRDDLAGGDANERGRAVLAWEEWQRSQPGPRTWVEDPSLVTDHAGSGLCLSAARNLFLGFYRATALAPLRVRALGPGTLRIEARPLHRKGARLPVDGWLLVRERDLLFPAAITGNLPAPALALIAPGDQVPGTRVAMDLELGPGLHELEIGARDLEVLARVLIQRPELDPGVLPPLTPASLEAVLAGRPPEPPPAVSTRRIRLVRWSGSVEAFPAPTAEAAAAPESPPEEPSDPILAARLALRRDLRAAAFRHADGLKAIGDGRYPVPADERFLAREALAAIDPAAAPGMPADAPGLPAEELPPAIREAACLAAGRISDALEVPPGSGADGAVRRMNLLVYAAEMEPERSAAARARGSSCFLAYPTAPGIQGLRSRLLRGGTWQPLYSIRDSAGVRYVEDERLPPESPELRVRRALLASPGGHERLLTGNGRLVVSLAGARQAVLEIEVRLAGVEYLPLLPLSAMYQLDGDRPRQVRLSPEEPRRSFRLVVPEGERAVRLWIAEPAPNHFLAVTVRELGEGGSIRTIDGSGGSPARRLYFLAAPDRPLRAAIEGPAWLRVDELRGDVPISRYREVPAGIHELALGPDPGREEALLRLFRFEDGAPPPPRPAPYREPPALPPPPPVAVQERQEAPYLEIEDAFPLGGQEDGTWTAAASLHRLRAIEEDRSSRRPDQFLQLLLAHRFYHQRSKTYFDTGILARMHEKSGPTLGAWEEIEHSPAWLPVVLRGGVLGFLQWPDGGVGDPAGPAEWSLTFRGTALRRFQIGLRGYHVPALAIFGRVLSLDDAGDYHPNDVDRDVFTRYKRDHRAGLVFSETVGYRPWLDTEWWARAAITSNEALDPSDPDHFTGWAGWKQLIDSWLIEADFRVAYYFDDADRLGDKVRQAISTRIEREFWWRASHRLEAGIEIQYDLTAGEPSGLVFFAWNFGHGRAYRDLAPGATDFEWLRSARIPPEQRGSVREAHPDEPY